MVDLNLMLMKTCGCFELYFFQTYVTLINCASSWPECGLFFSKCSLNILFHSVLYHFGENISWKVCRQMPLWFQRSCASPFHLYMIFNKSTMKQ